MEGIIKFANGKEYTGYWHGPLGKCTGEVIFYTEMGNLIEFISDPAVEGKIVVTTYPGLLNSEIDFEAFESDDFQILALITQQDDKDFSTNQSKWLSLFKEKQIPVLTNVDTRQMIKDFVHVGEMEATIYSQQIVTAPIFDKKAKEMNKKKKLIMNPLGKQHLVVLDFGAKRSLIQWLQSLNCKLSIVSGEISAREIIDLQPNGLIFSGGSGSPLKWAKYFHEYKEMAKAIPTIGFGLGHQILALAFGAKMEKLKWGHRKRRHPIIHTLTNSIFLSNQNHEYHILPENLQMTGFSPSFLSLQDQTIEGLVHEKYPIATYQFHPYGKSDPLELIIKESFLEQLQKTKGVNMYA